MNITKDTGHLLRCLLIYHLFKGHQCKYLAALKWPETARGEVETHLRKGCYVHLALIEERGELENLLLSQHELGQRGAKDHEWGKLAGAERKRAQTRWSNETNRMNLRALLNEAYEAPLPEEIDLRLALSEMKARCERLLNNAGYTLESELIRHVDL